MACFEFEDHDMKPKRILHCAIAALAIAGFAALDAGVVPANARPARNSARYGQSTLGAPVLAIVGLREQRISIYDANGKILEAPVSSGATGYETPAGIYSIEQKEEEHHSNLYDDASMPFMERITWTGMALHAGVLPGYAASHGCVRMPLAFAEQLYQITEVGMRVIVVREDIAPADIAQPALFNPSLTSQSAERSSTDGVPSAINVAVTQPGFDLTDRLRSTATAKALESEAAARREKEARRVAAKLAAEAAPAARSVREAEANVAKAEAELKASEKALETAGSPERTAQAETAKAQAATKVETAQAQLQSVRLQAQSKMEAAARAQEEVQAAGAAANLAADTSEEAQQNLSPVSVFISRKMQRLYIRKGNRPVFESPVTIRDTDRPIGTFVYTAVSYTGTPSVLRWNVVSMYKDAANVEPFVQVKAGGQTKGRQPAAAPAPADVASAQAALGRLVVPPEAAARISAVVLPGSSLIISDEGPSTETGKDTDFIVFMSGEPQGGIAIRQHNKPYRGEHDLFDSRAFGWFSDDDSSRRSSRGRRGGFPFFFSD
jgi:hypothetical protein